MSFSKNINLGKVAKARALIKLLFHPKELSRGLNNTLLKQRSHHFLEQHAKTISSKMDETKGQDYLSPGENPLRKFFEDNKSGNMIWKWEHYFDVYHHHFKSFCGSSPVVLEIGVYGGGSLEMWKHYFGAGSKIFGVDINPECKQYESKDLKIFIGDQEDRNFWRKLRSEIQGVDIIIDDGGHSYSQQIVTLEEILELLNPGGIYICEDILSRESHFTSYAQGFIEAMNALGPGDKKPGTSPSGVQKEIEFIQFHPYMMVLKKRKKMLSKLENRQTGIREK